LIRNALSVVAQTLPDLHIDHQAVLIIGPAWLNEFDQQYGAALATDLVFHGSQWQEGGASRSPNLTDSATSYEVLDWFTDWLFNQTTFPNLNSITFAGHSMGGQMVARYALLKKQKVYDDNIQYWIANPGSWPWLTDTRPNTNDSCGGFDEWHYGLGGNTSKISKYARKDVVADKAAIISRFRSRKIHYSFGLLDNGPGDTHCEALLQGANHLDRGSNFIQMLGAMEGGFPSTTQTVNFVANASHQDYAMMSANSSLQNIFKAGYDARLPDIAAFNPGDQAVNDTTEANPNPSPRAFATPLHKIISWILLGGSAAIIIISYTVLPYMFPPSINTWEQQEWQDESKRKLV
jgi:pimeloyl-ACP methyl ester carboxylesterase